MASFAQRYRKSIAGVVAVASAVTVGLWSAGFRVRWGEAFPRSIEQTCERTMLPEDREVCVDVKVYKDEIWAKTTVQNHTTRTTEDSDGNPVTETVPIRARATQAEVFFFYPDDPSEKHFVERRSPSPKLLYGIAALETERRPCVKGMRVRAAGIGVYQWSLGTTTRETVVKIPEAEATTCTGHNGPTFGFTGPSIFG